MQLKDALEAATDNIDVRPGFIGDVMTGARRRRTRNRVRLAAVIAVVTGLVGFGIGHEWRSDTGGATGVVPSGDADRMGLGAEPERAHFPLPRDAARFVVGTPAPPPDDKAILQAAGVQRVDLWRLTASLDNGESVLVTSFFSHDGVRLVGALYRTADAVDEVHVSPVVATSSLPAVLPLPRRGWVVVDLGRQLSYRTKAGEPWSPPKADADVLPVEATQLRFSDGRRYTAISLVG
ncbi:hypothetical protein Lesp02_23940 [Lentzea sp. NBRC 105346]|uniref:hypothetical protein n=1 Tax=Lentzea sp. NBRC 105346 TaxID=3032205 RepID=UPI0024A1F538|nr:hypothetical protein [Lentzea sp. NBRC 105346]GLZ30204.1 hypothetical protein Lesp02_23940 [Lentzea sp. NBRC 105346]